MCGCSTYAHRIIVYAAQARAILSPKRIHRIGKRRENTGFPAWSARMVPNLKFNLRDTQRRHPKTSRMPNVRRVCGCCCCWLLPYRHRTYAKRHAHGWATYTNTQRTYSYVDPLEWHDAHIDYSLESGSLEKFCWQCLAFCSNGKFTIR